MRFSFLRLFSFLTAAAICATLLPVMNFAHGGEDHGEQKPKSTANAKGIVTHSARIGDFEVMIKHQVLEPDVATSGRLFITKFETNEPFKNAVASVEIESANGNVSLADVEAGEQPGIYNVKIPALPEGTYTMRTKLSYDGETDTATFSGIEVKPAVAAAAETSWLTNALIGIVFSLVVFLLGGLILFVWRFAGSPAANKEALSA